MIPVNDDKQRADVEAISELLLGEVNVKGIKFIGNEDGVLVKRVKPDFKKLGPKFGKNMKGVASAIQAMSQKDIVEFEKNGTFAFVVNGEDVTVEVADVEIQSEDIPGWLVANDGNLTVALDITVTDELRREGIARDIVNRIQNIRKDSDFNITDRINVVISANEATDAAVVEYKEYISKQVLALSLEIGNTGDDATELEIDDIKLSVKVTKA